jgi:allantoicase
VRESWPFWRRYLNLAQPRLGAEVVSVTDDFFGAAERLIRPEEPIFVPGKYDENGKWMDGWESRRRRDGGHDACVVRLGGPATVHGVDIDTRFFDGNQPQAASLEASSGPAGPAEPDPSSWFEILPRTELAPNAPHRIEIAAVRNVRWLRLRIFPDGGVARLRVYGLAEPPQSAPGELLDLVAAENGGSIVAASDEHFGAAAKLLLPGRGLDMGDGWETRRRRGPGFDWVIVALARPGRVERVVLDTAHFKGNFPHQASLQGAWIVGGGAPEAAESESWPELLPKQLLRADAEHSYAQELASPGALSHLRLNIFPDGGVSRLRAFGRVEPGA